MKNTGTLFEDRFRNWHKDLEKVVCIKYPDNRTSGTYSRAICDYLVLYKGITMFIELKRTKNKVSFSFGLIRKHQLESLLDIAHTGNPAFFFVENGLRDLYLIQPAVIFAYVKNKKKSIKFDELSHCKITKKQYLDFIQ